jgi:hypothetical protein
VTEQAAERRPKKDAESRIRTLVRRVHELEEELEAARSHNEGLIDWVTPAEQEQQSDVNDFMSKCKALCAAQPEFDQYLSRIADFPDAWLYEIARMPNGPGFIVFLAGAKEFLEYLRELRPDKAVKRIRQAGYDMHSKLPKFLEGR